MHTTFLVVSIAIAALVTPIGYAQVMPPASALQIDERDVLAAEDDYVAAEVSRDEAVLRRMVDDRFVFNSSRGITTNKEELIQGVLNMAMVGQTVRERSVLVEGNIAFVFGTAELRFANPGKPESVSSLRYTATWVKRQGQWRMLALQMQQRAPN
jgi:ketosteroid isomerase-like protein